jgi:hypothetical protein
MEYLYIIDNTPKITEWIQAIAAIIAIPAAIVTFYKLIKRDRDKQKQIKMLTEIASENQKQTQQFEYQSILMKESNDIFREQLNAISLSLSQNKDLNETIKDFEFRKRKVEIKPHFIFSGSFSSVPTGTIVIKLKNIGKNACLKNIKSENQNISFPFEDMNNRMINHNDEIKIIGNIKDNSLNINIVDFSFKLIFTDEDNNYYEQLFNRINNTYKVENPIEIIVDNH